MVAIAVDLDNTLTDRPATFQSWVQGFIEHYGIADSDAVDYLAELDADGFSNKHEVFTAAQQRWEIDTSVDELIEHFYTGMLQALSLSPTTRSGLESLRDAGYQIVVVTNGSPRQWDKVDRLNLRRYVDGIAVSSTVGARKPDRAIFEAAASDAGIAVDDIEWMVGDNPEADIGGARELGARSVWLRRGRTWTLTAYRPTVTVDGFDDAVATILK